MREPMKTTWIACMTLVVAAAGWAGCSDSEPEELETRPDDLKRRRDAGAARPCGARLGDTCEEGEFCDWTLEGICGFADATGVCKPIPEACTLEYAPVCGCDGNTYSNACSANAAGVSVQREEPCEDAGVGPGPAPADAGPGPGPGCGPDDGGAVDAGSPARVCGGLAGLPCADGEFCNFEGDPSGVACGAADGTGVCEPIPEICTDQYDPVCGCDDKTYGNDCEAHAQGVSVASRGECASQGPVSCDPRAILCRRAPPKCPGGQVPSVSGSCYGDCVPVEQCACSDAPECPLPDIYTCHRSAGHCGPYVN